jgi:hypothetical protein
MKVMQRVTWMVAVMMGFCLKDMPGLAAVQAPEEDVKIRPTSEQPLTLRGNRFLTFNTVVRVRQIEVTRDVAHGPDESSVHTAAEARTFREAIEAAWPGARITWAFSWLALHDERAQYRELRDLVVSYQKKFGDEITFIPGAYFSNMYNTREQVNRDLHEGLKRVSEIVGDGYRPKSVVAGFLAAENLRYLAEKENIHVCQGNIWSQYAVDNGDGEGSICYPYYPSREHFCKPAQGKADLIDCVNLDGWTVDFLCGRIPGGRRVNGEPWRSRQGVGPIETLLDMGTERGTKAMLATTAAHFDDGFERNGFAWVTCGWEMSLVEARKIYGYGGKNGMEGLHLWLTEIRKRWPNAKLITQGEFGLLWREQFKNNDQLDYRFVQRGCGIRASESDKEISWFMNADFRLALLRDLKTNAPAQVMDFTRYDLPAAEPADPEPGKQSRNWSLMNRLNQKGVRPQDKPISLQELTPEEQALIQRRYPELIRGKTDEAAWHPLFNGRDLSGWTVQCKSGDQGKSFWQVDAGTILCESLGRPDHDYCWLVSDKEYGDFELRLKFQAYTNSPGNSGIQFRSRYDKDDQGGWLNGPQVDIHPPASQSWRTGLIYDETRGEQRWVSPSLPNSRIGAEHKLAGHVFKTANEGDGWNDLVITARGNHIKTVVNGVVCTDWDGAGTLDNAAHRAKNVGSRGHFALQLHVKDQLRIRFKDIAIRELDSRDASGKVVVDPVAFVKVNP